MLFLVDESCDFAVVRALREEGHDVVAVAEPRAEDDRVIEPALYEFVIHPRIAGKHISLGGVTLPLALAQLNLIDETIENPASNFMRLDGRDDFHTAATARALQHEKWAK